VSGFPGLSGSEGSRTVEGPPEGGHYEEVRSIRAAA
jgi:hypothetical protein